jgi:hypothetical protein
VYLMKMEISCFDAGVKIDFIIDGKHRIINSTFHSHREGLMTNKLRKATRRFQIFKQPNKDLDKKLDSQAASAAKSCLNAMIAKIVKVRPQDPSCMAWYMHMNALC